MVKYSSTWTWAIRIALSALLFGILLLNIKVLSRKSQSDDTDSTTNDQLLLTRKVGGRRTLKQPLVSADESQSSTIANKTKEQAEPESRNSKRDIALLGPPKSQPRNCKQPHCKEYLQKSELLAMSKCSAETSKRTVNGRLNGRQESTLKESSCSFMNGSNRLPVALASTSGSGNTWIRGLLEKATGICTGFLYCDYAMRREGFIGESIKSGSALVVKTHTIAPKWYGTKTRAHSDDPYYGSAIYILRSPYKSMIAEWNRRVTYDMLRVPDNESHTNVVQEKFWRIPQWEEFLPSYMERWKSRLRNWVLDSSRQAVHVVRYEDLQQDVPREVAKMLSFLKIPFSKDELPLRLESDFTTFKRKHTNDNFEHYSISQTEHIRSVLMDTIKLAQEANKSDILRIEEYLT